MQDTPLNIVQDFASPDMPDMAPLKRVEREFG